MDLDFLDFEQPIADLRAKIDQLHFVSSEEDAVNIVEEIERLEVKCDELTANVFSKLNSAQISQLSRHPQRPYTFDYIDEIFTDFIQLHGDRSYGDDKALIAGVAKIDGIPVAILGQQKGRGTKEKLKRNFGMPRPEGYRKAKRIMKLAEKFKLPLITFIDTPGAYPGVGAEERGQSESIASNLAVLAELKTPVIATVIGEGGSGGALAIGVADRVNMLQYSTYSVISPEGCATILWKSAKNSVDAAEAMGLTAKRLKELKLIDDIVDEPLGGAHRDYSKMAASLKIKLLSDIHTLKSFSIEKILDDRYEKIMSYGNFEIKD